ncbi:MAG: HesA/MoeB/ThiF family protein [Syntrophales bacterium]|nr:HesA/MoeB/ThiF family protein [Syntrophales bacterium]MDD5642165.1 HesA/MoeB/ThiF family protein [Syntrophales bacterium]
MPPDFSEEENRRYARNIMLPQVGIDGQKRWRDARVAVVGAGGIGSAALYYLAAAGVGRIGIIDGDAVETSNLQRQILYDTHDLGRRKVESAWESLTALNPHCVLKLQDKRLDAVNIRDILKENDLVLDASDNFATRLLVADCCWREKIPLVSAAVGGFQGLLLVMDPEPGNPCYRCLLPQEPAPSGREGILGAVAGVMGCLQATEALKLLLGRKSDLTRQLLSYDALRCRFRHLKREKNPDCPLCGQ